LHYHQSTIQIYKYIRKLTNAKEYMVNLHESLLSKKWNCCKL